MDVMQTVSRNDTWNPPHPIPDHTRSGILTEAQRDLFELINTGILTTTVCTFGIVSNIINIIVFIKQGFTSSVNISLFAMAISDLMCLLFLLWHATGTIPPFLDLPLSFEPREIQYISGSVQHVCFSRITNWITMFVTMERCLGITLPLKVKEIVTPRRTVIVLASIYLINILEYVPEYSICYLDVIFEPKKNKTLVVFRFNKDNEVVGMLSFLLSAVTGILSFVLVTIFTVILVVQLKKKSEWRKTVSSAGEKGGSMSKDKRTMKMVILIASTLILCYFPGVVVTLVTLFEPQFRIEGRFGNTFVAMWTIPLLLHSVNASVNIFYYYRMSTLYRQEFDKLFSCLCCKAKHIQHSANSVNP